MEGKQAQQPAFDEVGFLRTLAGWKPSLVETMAEEIGISPLTESHWKVIEYVRGYYETKGVGPPVVRIAKATGLSSGEICRLFPCGVVRGVYRLAGLPRPAGCA